MVRSTRRMEPFIWISFAPCVVTAGVRYEAILLPAESLSTGHMVTLHYANGEVYTWKMHQQIPKLEAGKMYEYDVTITKHEVKGTSGWGIRLVGFRYSCTKRIASAG